MRENVLEHVVTTPLPVRMPLQATGQSEKLIVQPCWRAILAQQPLMAAAVSPPGCAILTHRLCYRAQVKPLQECSGSFSLSGIKVQSTQMEEDVRLEALFVPIAKGLFDQPLDFIV